MTGTSNANVVINQKIVGVSLVKKEEDPSLEPSAAQVFEPKSVQMHEGVTRPDTLRGSTYKVTAPILESALYITINDIVINEGTEDERYHPFEIFINSKNMDHFQWIVALTRVISAVFRKGGDATFLVEELRSVFEPSGGYFKKGGKFVPSLVAEIGDVIEKHYKYIGLIPADEGHANQKSNVVAHINTNKQNNETTTDASDEFPPEATVCKKCKYRALVQSSGCEQCLNCDYSRCG